MRSIVRTTVIIATLAATAISLAQAGAPLVCHPFEIGDADSLPAVAAGRSSSPAVDVLAVLDGGAPVIVRMETLRRAAVVEDGDFGEVLDRLRLRAEGAERRGSAGAQALFDYGYALETAKQSSWWLKLKLALSDTDGYAKVERAIQLSGGDPEMEFAAALIAVYPERPRHEEHLRRAIEGAREGTPLARNLVAHFGHRGATLGALQASLQKSK